MGTTSGDRVVRDLPTHVVVISYFAGLPSYVGAVWTDDKLRALRELQIKYTLVSSSGGMRDRRAERHFRITSLSRVDFLREKSERGSWKTNSEKISSKPFGNVLSLTVGRVLDAVLTLVLGKHSDGRLSWAIMAAPLVLLLALRHRRSIFLVTGGPSSAHMLGALAGFFGVRVIAELQDPLIGDHMQLGPRAKLLLRKFERFVLKNADTVVFTSDRARLEALQRNAEFAGRLKTIYPGVSEHRPCDDQPQLPFEKTLVHLGTLYGSRNLDKILSEISRIKKSDPELDVGVLNVGYVEPQILRRYEDLDTFSWVAEVPRNEAICIAKSSYATLLIQHMDGRAAATIPYKTYDYASSGMPTCIVLNASQELAMLCSQFGNFKVVQGNLGAIVRSIIIPNTPTQNPSAGNQLSIKNQLMKVLGQC